MIKSNIKKQFSCDKNKLWDIITDNSNYKWRTDLLKIEIKDEKLKNIVKKAKDK